MAKTKNRSERPVPLIGGFWGRCGRDPNTSHFFQAEVSLCPTHYNSEGIPQEWKVRRECVVTPGGHYTPTRYDCKPCTKLLDAQIAEVVAQRLIEQEHERVQAEIDAAIGEAEAAAEAEQRWDLEQGP